MPRFRTATELQSFYARLKSNHGGRWFDFEPIIQSVYLEIVKPGDSAIDAGAHRGLHTLPLARQVGVHGSVTAIEPIHKLAWLLQVRIRVEAPELASSIRVIEVAVSKFTGSATFILASDPAYSGLQPRVYPADTTTRTIRVNVDTLDNLCSDLDRLSFIKLDLEGGEFDAIRGGAGIIRKHRPVLVFEYDVHRTPAFYGFRHQEVLDFFAELEYDIVDVLGVPFDNPKLWNSAKVWYYFAIPREQRPHAPVLKAIERAAGEHLS